MVKTGLLRTILAAVAVMAAWSTAGAQDPWSGGPSNGPAYGPAQSSGQSGDYRYNMPAPPTQPGMAVRPNAWPTGRVVPAAATMPVSPSPIQLPPQAQLCENAQRIARAGNEVILTSDILASVDEFMSRNRDRISPEKFEAERKQVTEEITAGLRQLVAHLDDPNPVSYVDPQRRAIIQQLLRQQIERKLIYQDFRRTVPAEALPNIEEALGRQFEQTELPRLLKQEKVQSRDELETKLRARGASLARQQRMFNERAIAEQWAREQIKIDKEITHEQMLAWYEAHLKDFDRPARARWEELMVSFSRYRNNEEAYAAVARMGNQVLSGAPLAEVAKAQSHGPTASSGGVRDWTIQGSLAAEELDRALFSLPPGQLSRIIEGKTGYHIIRVIEREDASRAAFHEVQKEIREKIQKERLNTEYRAFVERVLKRFPIWTVFDADTPRRKPDAEEPSRY